MALEGELGSGKTVFTKGIAIGLGIKEQITSPTFVIVKQYQISNIKYYKYGKSPLFLVHIDCYRINNPDDAESIGLKEYFESKDNITIIEWAENIKSILPKVTKYIKLEHLRKDQRKITIL